jgi:hypothetical protein
MWLIDIILKIVAVIGSIWMLALAYKIVGDTWDSLFSIRYKKWLSKFSKHTHKYIKSKLKKRIK